MTIQTIVEISALNEFRAAITSAGQKLAFVPTMGALHDGHISLVKQALSHADVVIASIFVNPSQFGPGEDFDRYPRTLTEDVTKLQAAGCSAVFLPNVTTIYPDRFQTWVHNEVLENELCGASRPGHFRGVLTVVLKLLNLVRPDVAVFGKKDYQQWRLIEKMTEDLNIPVAIVGADIIRETDGLAMSSRNRYLTEAERPIAATIAQALQTAQAKFAAGERGKQALIDAARVLLEKQPSIQIEYLTIREQKSLRESPDTLSDSAVMLLAARLGELRLIDNIELVASGGVAQK